MTALSSEAQNVRVMPHPEHYRGTPNETCVSLDAAAFANTAEVEQLGMAKCRPNHSGPSQETSSVVLAKEARGETVSVESLLPAALSGRPLSPKKRPPSGEWAEQIAKVNL